MILTHDLRISGALRAGNIVTGEVSIAPLANSPTSYVVSGHNLAGAGATRAWVTANTLVPGTVLGLGVTDITPFGFTIWVYRTNTTATIVRWISIRDLA